MKIIIQTLDHKTVDIIINDDATIIDLKNKIVEIKNQPIQQIKLIFNGAVLSDDFKKLSDYKIINNSKLVLYISKNKLETKKEEIKEIKENETINNIIPNQNLFSLSNENNDNYQYSLNFTEEQEKDIDDILTMGCGSYEEIIQYYIAFDYNKELTVNALFNEFNY